MLFFRNKYHLFKALLLGMLTANFIYIGSLSFSRMDMDNCCQTMNEVQSCCSSNSETLAPPSCHSKDDISVKMKNNNCGCFHNNPATNTHVVLKNKIELPKSFASKIVFENEDEVKFISTNANNTSYNLSVISSPIYIVNSAFLI